MFAAARILEGEQHIRRSVATKQGNIIISQAKC